MSRLFYRKKQGLTSGIVSYSRGLALPPPPAVAEHGAAKQGRRILLITIHKGKGIFFLTYGGVYSILLRLWGVLKPQESSNENERLGGVTSCVAPVPIRSKPDSAQHQRHDRRDSLSGTFGGIAPSARRVTARRPCAGQYRYPDIHRRERPDCHGKHRRDRFTGTGGAAAVAGHIRPHISPKHRAGIAQIKLEE